MDAKTILVVDDDQLVLQVTKSMVEHGGYSVITAADGEEALEILATQGASINLLLTDVKMPRMDGVTLAERVLDLRLSIPILFMTGYRSGAEALQRMASIVSKTGGLVRKPFRLHELLDRIAAALVA